MGMPRLVDVGNVTGTPSLRLSHAVQRVMFWAEAGRDAYKDDGEFLYQINILYQLGNVLYPWTFLPYPE